MLGARTGSPQPDLPTVTTHHLATPFPRSGFVHGREADI